jgi:rhamnosyltransferase
MISKRNLPRARHNASSERPRICAVMVTYFPRHDLAEVLAALAPQVDELVIVDNGSSAEKLEGLSASASKVKATFLPLGTNRGIAHALNVGLEHARRQDCQWLATFDQDSLALPTMLDEMLSAIQRYPQPARIAMLAPVQIDPHSGFHLEPDTCELRGSGWRVLYTTMTSGNLVNVATATAIGGFEESFFIDYVDHEFCLRLRRHGYQVLEVTEAHLTHSLGELSTHRLGGRRIWVTHHSVTRRYYMSRNRLILWWRYFRSEPTWVRRDMRAFASELVRIVLYERESGAKLRMVLRGTLDAIRGVRGPLNSPPAHGEPAS